MGRYPTVDEEAGDELVIELAIGELKTPPKSRDSRRKPERPSWRILAKRMLSRHRQREFIWAALRKEKKPCRASLPKSPTVRSASRKTRPASPPSPPRSKKRQEPSWARMSPA